MIMAIIEKIYGFEESYKNSLHYLCNKKKLFCSFRWFSSFLNINNIFWPNLDFLCGIFGCSLRKNNQIIFGQGFL